MQFMTLKVLNLNYFCDVISRCHKNAMALSYALNAWSGHSLLYVNNILTCIVFHVMVKSVSCCNFSQFRQTDSYATEQSFYVLSGDMYEGYFLTAHTFCTIVWEIWRNFGAGLQNRYKGPTSRSTLLRAELLADCKCCCISVYLIGFNVT
jgi:hypothetical protein